MDKPVPLPIDGVLDLHTFRPDEIGELIREYVTECRLRGILVIRIIHGKGTGQLRLGVHALLQMMPEVDSFRLADQALGGWGATLVTLKSHN